VAKRWSIKDFISAEKGVGYSGNDATAHLNHPGDSVTLSIDKPGFYTEDGGVASARFTIDETKVWRSSVFGLGIVTDELDRKNTSEELVLGLGGPGFQRSYANLEGTRNGDKDLIDHDITITLTSVEEAPTPEERTETAQEAVAAGKTGDEAAKESIRAKPAETKDPTDSAAENAGKDAAAAVETLWERLQALPWPIIAVAVVVPIALLVGWYLFRGEK